MVESRNRLDQLVYSTEKTLGEHKEKLSADSLGALESALAEAKTALESGDSDTLNKAIENLTQASHKLAEAMYKASGQPGASESAAGQEQPPPPQGEKPKEEKDDVVDAEFVDVDDDKKE